MVNLIFNLSFYFLQTNHPEFALEETSVRRRYREFVWLKNRLGMNDVMMV